MAHWSPGTIFIHFLTKITTKTHNPKSCKLINFISLFWNGFPCLVWIRVFLFVLSIWFTQSNSLGRFDLVLFSCSSWLWLFVYMFWVHPRSRVLSILLFWHFQFECLLSFLWVTCSFPTFIEYGGCERWFSSSYWCETEWKYLHSLTNVVKIFWWKISVWFMYMKMLPFHLILRATPLPLIAKEIRQSNPLKLKKSSPSQPKKSGYSWAHPFHINYQAIMQSLLVF